MVQHRFGAQDRHGVTGMTRNILFLCHRLPYPPNKGDKIRSYALLRHLAERGKVSLGCFLDEREDMQYLDAVLGLARGDCHFEFLTPLAKMSRSAVALLKGHAITTACFKSNRLQKWLDQLLQGTPFDDVVIFGSAMAPYLLGTKFPERRVMFDMVDVDSDKWKQYGASTRGPLGWIYRREAHSLEKLERDAAAAFGHTLLVSPFEAETFRQIAPESADKISSLTNGVDLGRFSPGARRNPFPVGDIAIVMTGRMDYRPNYAGALWFTSAVMPHILKSRPNARVYFVGAAPPRALRALAGPNVVVTGRVPDVEPYLQYADAVVAPLRIARGVQNKVLEAMAMAKPVVATYEATRSLAVESGIHLWIENDPRRFATAVLAALDAPDRHLGGQIGRRYVERHHNWQQILAEFDVQLDALTRSASVASRGLAELSPRDPRWESTDTGVAR